MFGKTEIRMINPRNNLETFRAHVVDGTSAATVLCYVYDLMPSQHEHAVELTEVVTSFDNSGVASPIGRAFTFQEELRRLNRAARVFQGPRSDVEEWLTSLMKEAYGPTCVVTLDKPFGN